jgi:uncharacterized protein YjbI with pentapeptide repeats
MSDAEPKRPKDDNREAWQAYWAAQGTPWRTEPEIDEERQAYLADRRAVKPDIEKGIYPFRDENGGIKLTRADVEWLLVTHENGRGPVDWSDDNQREREGLDLRGTDLRQVNLCALPLAHLHGGLRDEERQNTPTRQREVAGMRMDAADLSSAHLERAHLYLASLMGSNLFNAQMQRADLARAHLEGANLFSAHLEGTDLRYAFFDTGSYFRHTSLSSGLEGAARVSGVHWDGADLTEIDWTHMEVLGDEQVASQPRDQKGAQTDNASRLSEYARATRANRQLAKVLRNQGLNEHADRFAYRAQVLQRQVLRRQGNPVRAIGSWLLDLLAGHGYKPGRTLVAYLLAILSFGTAYYFLGQAVGPHLSPLGAFVFSMTSFHGRGFFPGGIALDDPITVLAALEAFVGLVIEVSFIATFTQRFFAR